MGFYCPIPCVPEMHVASFRCPDFWYSYVEYVCDGATAGVLYMVACCTYKLHVFSCYWLPVPASEMLQRNGGCFSLILLTKSAPLGRRHAWPVPCRRNGRRSACRVSSFLASESEVSAYRFVFSGWLVMRPRTGSNCFCTPLGFTCESRKNEQGA